MPLFDKLILLKNDFITIQKQNYKKNSNNWG